MPTLDELNQAAPDTPVFVLHLYDRALLNRAALRASVTPRVAESARGRNCSRRGRQSDRGPHRSTERDDPLLTLAKGPKLRPNINSTPVVISCVS
jgi:predicted amidohydrolase YtcJ